MGNGSLLHMVDVWQEHLNYKMQEAGYEEMLEVVVQDKVVQRGEGLQTTSILLVSHCHYLF